jgi:glycosyltransferase involved in cell wall biosynthesis
MIFLADLPNPVHGMSNANLAMLTEFIKTGVNPRVINTTPSYASKYFNTFLYSLIKFGHSFVCLVKLFFHLLTSKQLSVYRSIYGGNGQIYDLLYITICRLFSVRIYIHHHSFAYLDKKRLLFSTLNKFSGRHSTHIVLGKRMKKSLSNYYQIGMDRIIIISNLALFNDPTNSRFEHSTKKIKIGHLANLSAEKGIDVFIDICGHLNGMGIDYSAKIAGPFSTHSIRELVSSAVQNNSNLEYIGSVYGEEKEAFYKKLDCFIFPSKYKNEAEPLVLYEAASYGVFLIGTRRGCMQDVINDFSGFSLSENKLSSKLIAQEIEGLVQRQEFINERRENRISRYKETRLNAKKTLCVFIKDISKLGV